jgi:hypothetical protein
VVDGSKGLYSRLQYVSYQSVWLDMVKPATIKRRGQGDDRSAVSPFRNLSGEVVKEG